MSWFGHPRQEPAGFAVVDVETTGLYPSVDRVVEVGIVLLNARAEITGEFCTLIDPRRDVGPTRIHGLRAANVTGAPVFENAAGAVWEQLAGRVLVAHNARFDVAFLDAEFRRCGMQLPPPPVMCTMELSSQYLRYALGRSLAACCEAAAVPLGVHHSALDDARAAAGLLAVFRSVHQDTPDSWRDALAAAAGAAWQPAPAWRSFRPVTRGDQVLRRAADRPRLVTLIDHLPRGLSGTADAYLGVLDRVLEDRYVSDDEMASLTSMASEFGITREAAEAAHRMYLRSVCDAAWRDGVVTDAERADLLEVARLVGVPAGEALEILSAATTGPAALPRDPRSGLAPGDRVVLTGDMSLPRAELTRMAGEAGLRVTSAVSGKTALLVVADPYSQSGKARQAREMGVRIVTDQVFLHMLEQMADAASLTV